MRGATHKDAGSVPRIYLGIDDKHPNAAGHREFLYAFVPTLFEARRGRGLIQGLKCIAPAGEVQAACYGEDMMIATAGENVARLMPALVVSDADIAEAVKRFRAASTKMMAAAKVAAQ